MSDISFPFCDRFLGFSQLPTPSQNLEGKTHPYAIVGLPYDGAVTNRPGARFGPQAIRRASQMLCDGTHPLWDVSLHGHVIDYGDLAIPNTQLSAARQFIRDSATALLQKEPQQ